VWKRILWQRFVPGVLVNSGKFTINCLKRTLNEPGKLGRDAEMLRGLLRYEWKDRFHRLAIEGLIELSYLSVVITTIYIHEYSYT